MSYLKYIVLSDLHLGEQGSLFTPSNNGEPIMINALGECLLQILNGFEQNELPKLVLNGDILGLSFSNYDDSLPIFEMMLKVLTQTKRICDNIIYLPGNHDHHIWSLTKEEQFKNALKNRTIDSKIPKLNSVTEPIFEKGIVSDFFKVFTDVDTLKDFKVKIFYPNYLALPNNEQDPFIIFHHGHFSENTYHFVTNAMMAFFPDLEIPKNLEELEASNGSFIDFAFSELGRSGKAGKKFKELMAILSDKNRLKRRIEDLSDNIADAVDFPYIPFDALESELARTLLINISEHVRSERYNGDTTCSDKTMAGLMDYIDNYCDGILDKYGLGGQSASLIWSHTHKPFQKTTETQKFGKLKIINTGGWVLPPKPIPLIGASIVLVDDHNEAQSLRIFNDTDDGNQIQFKISLEHNEDETEFSKKINSIIYDNGRLREPFRDFGNLIYKTIKIRRGNE